MQGMYINDCYRLDIHFQSRNIVRNMMVEKKAILADQTVYSHLMNYICYTFFFKI
jgi:hypothetical protein